jgi:cell division septation protein DedD
MVFRYSIIAFIVCIVFWGCSSSENVPQQKPNLSRSRPKTDTLQQKNTAPSVKKVAKKDRRSSKKEQGFVAKEDTIEAQIVSQKWMLKKPAAANPQPAGSKYYSVQVAAFRDKENADRYQELMKKRFQKPVIQFYDRVIKLHRVLVGNFSQKKAAQLFLDSIKKQYPAEYKSSWIEEMK